MHDVSKYEMDTVLALVDIDNSGLCDFGEFCRTCIHPSEMLTKDSL